MSKKVFGKWLQRNTRKTHTEYFEDIGIEVKFEGLLYSEFKNLIKDHTVVLKGGQTKFEDEEFETDLIARTIKEADGEPIDLTSKADLEEIGAQNTKEALDMLFTLGEIQRVAQIAKDLAGLDEKEEKKEIEELKN